jgi:hypothetical protein
VTGPVTGTGPGPGPGPALPNLTNIPRLAEKQGIRRQTIVAPIHANLAAKKTRKQLKEAVKHKKKVERKLKKLEKKNRGIFNYFWNDLLGMKSFYNYQQDEYKRNAKLQELSELKVSLDANIKDLMQKINEKQATAYEQSQLQTEKHKREVIEDAELYLSLLEESKNLMNSNESNSSTL